MDNNEQVMPTPIEMPAHPTQQEQPALAPDLNAAVAQGQPKTIDDVASMTFGLYFPKFCMAVDKLNAKSLRRVLKALVGVPLEDMAINLNKKEEKQLFGVGQHLMEAKMALIFSQLIKSSETVSDQSQNEPQTSDVNHDTQEGDVNNGSQS